MEIDARDRRSGVLEMGKACWLKVGESQGDRVLIPSLLRERERSFSW